MQARLALPCRSGTLLCCLELGLLDTRLLFANLLDVICVEHAEQMDVDRAIILEDVRMHSEPILHGVKPLGDAGHDATTA